MKRPIYVLFETADGIKSSRPEKFPHDRLSTGIVRACQNLLRRWGPIEAKLANIESRRYIFYRWERDPTFDLDVAVFRETN